MAGFDAGLLPDVQMEHCAGGEESRIVKGVHPVVEIVGRTETKLHVAVMVEQRFGRCFHLHELRTGRDVGIFRRIPADHADGMAALMPGTREIQSDLCVEVAFVIDGVQRSLFGDCRRGDACASRGFGQSLRPDGYADFVAAAVLADGIPGRDGETPFDRIFRMDYPAVVSVGRATHFRDVQCGDAPS